jgi:phospholipase/carboxylesterase
MLETDLSLRAEISLYYDLFVPEDLPEPAPLLIAVHGYGAHKRYMMREAQRVAPEDFVIVSVQGPHQHYRPTKEGYRVGFGWLTDHNSEEYVTLHHEFLLRIIDKLDKDGLIDRYRIHLFGFSQACALNFRFAFTHPKILASVVGVCGGIPGDVDENPKYKPFKALTFYLYGNDDEFYTQDQFAAFDSKLRATLPNYRSKHYVATHEITDEMRRDIKQFLAEVR